MRPDARRYVQVRSVGLCRVLLFGFGLALLGRGAVAATREPVRFDIPAQTMTAALDAYGAATGVEIFYDGDLAIGRRSSAVNGVLAPDAALRELLVGSGLVARATGPNSFTIVSASASHVANAAYRSYFAAIQSRVSQALCARAQTRSTDVDLLVRLWITTAGMVRQVQLVDADDDRAREGALAAALRGLSINAAPPAGMPQPVTMAILARGKDEPTGCADAAAGAR